jgi:hypothetical protein
LKKIVVIAIIATALLLLGKSRTGGGRKAIYVRPYTTRNGVFVPGKVRKAYSTRPDALKRRTYNKSYYQRNKWRYKKRRS